MAALKAAIASGLDEMQHSHNTASAGYKRLLAIQHCVQVLGGPYPLPLLLDREDAILLCSSVTMTMARQGYVAGRPEAINALISLRRKLDRLLRGNH